MAGTNVPGATSTSYTRANVQAADSGDYSVTVSNMVGLVASSNGVLTVLVPPAIVAQPQSQSAFMGATATFTVEASGTPPFSYQWRFEGTNITGGTDSSYTRLNLQGGDAGNYSVLITNLAGSIASMDAALLIVLPQPLTFNSVTLLPGGWLQLLLSGAPGVYTLQTSSNLTDWDFAASLTNVSGTVEFTDEPVTNQVQRYFRALSAP
jgi:hypothetical protein